MYNCGVRIIDCAHVRMYLRLESYKRWFWSMESQKEIQGHEEQLPVQIEVEVEVEVNVDSNTKMKVGVEVDVEKCSASSRSDEWQWHKRSRTPGTWCKQLSKEVK